MNKDYSAEIDLGDRNSAHTKLVEMTGANKRVIDFGCYTGTIAAVLKERGCQVTGIEIDPEAAEKARSVCDDVIVADLDELELAEALGPGAYDVGLFGDVIEHLKNPARLLMQTRELLAPGGYILVSVPNIAHASIRLMMMRGEFDYDDLGILDDTHLKYFTRKSVSDLLESCGYMVEVMDWTESRVTEESVRSALDPLGMCNLEEVLKSLTSWEALAYQYVIKAFPATEEAQVKRLSEDKVQAERRVRELEAEAEEFNRRQAELLKRQSELLKKDAYLEEIEIKLNHEVEKASQELAKVGQYVKELERKIDDKDTYIYQLEQTISERGHVIDEQERRIAQVESKLAELEAAAAKGRKRLGR